MSKQDIITVVIFTALMACVVFSVVHFTNSLSIESVGEGIKTIEEEFNKGYSK